MIPNTSVALPPEIELVMLAAGELNPARRSRLQELVSSKLDWELVIKEAAAHTITPQLYRACEVSGGVPVEIGNRLQARCKQIAINNLVFAGELDRLCRGFNREGIRILPLKGPTLAELAHGDLSMRQFSDLDVLIHPDDYQRASQLLVSMGYRIGYGLNDEQQHYNLARYGEALHSGDRMDVDLHVRLSDERFGFVLTFDELWEGRQRVTVAGGSQCSTLSNEYLCLYLLIHGSKHHWQRLKWICDIARFLQPNFGVDWLNVLSEARDRGCERIVLLGLSLAEQVCGSTLPSDLSAKCRLDLTTKKMTDLIVARLSDPFRPIGIIDEFQFTYRCRGRLGEAVRWVAAMTFLPHVSDWRWLRLPRPLWFLYGFLRPLRLAAKYASRPWSKQASSAVMPK